MAIVVVHDAIHANISHLPPGPAAGYTTGSPDIRWTAADWAAHPKAVRIDQDFNAADPTADVLDVERGAATNTEAARWYHQALNSFNTARRPGQRRPAIYTSAGNVTPLVNALIADGVHSGPRLWVAKWDFNSADDIAAITNAGGPYPVIGGQFADGTPGRPFDTSVFSSAWLNDVSGAPDGGGGPPFRHLANGLHSWVAIATRRNTTAEHLMSYSAQHYSQNDKTLISKLRLRRGTPYYTENP